MIISHDMTRSPEPVLVVMHATINKARRHKEAAQ